MKLRKRQVVLLTVLVILAVLGIAATAYHLRAKRALASYQKLLVASGEKLTVDELLPRHVLPEQNGAGIINEHSFGLMTFRRDLFATNPPVGMAMVTPGKARIAWAQSEVRSLDGKGTNSWAEVLAHVETLAATLDSLEQLTGRPHLNFDLNYRQGFSLPLPHLTQERQAAQMLCHAAICDLHRGDAASATRRLRATLALVGGSGDEPLVISQLVRIATAATAYSGTWELLQSPYALEEQLASLQDDWASLEFSRAAENALAMDRAIVLMTVEQMRESSAEFRKVTGGFIWPAAAPVTGAGGDWIDGVQQLAESTWETTRLKAKETAWRFSWANTDQLRTLQGLQVLIESIRAARPPGNFHAAAQDMTGKLSALGFRDFGDDVVALFDENLDLRTMFSKSVLSVTPFYKRVMGVEATRQLVVTSIALQRFKLAHGNYPSNLNALVPKYLTAVPRDPVDGEPLRYRLNPDRTFLLYSVGGDGADNGGDPTPTKPSNESLSWQHGRDWVWLQPATSGEIEEHSKRKPQ